MKKNTPVSCYLNDRLEEIATLKLPCTITYLNEDNECITASGQIIDIYAADGADWCKLSDDTVISLDRIEEFES